MSDNNGEGLLDTKTTAFLARRQHKLLIANEWLEAAHGARIDVTNPANETILGSVPGGGPADINRAVKAARLAFDTGPWGRARPADRQRHLLRLADLVERDAEVLAQIESLDNGK